MHGRGGAAVYIDTNRGFSIDRIRGNYELDDFIPFSEFYFNLFTDIAKATYEHCELTYRNHNTSFDRNEFSCESILNNIHCMFCDSYVELLIAIQKLRALLMEYPKVTSLNNTKIYCC